MNETCFLNGEKNSFEKVRVAAYFIFILKNEIKQERKVTSKFWKNMSLKSPSLSHGIRLLIGKVPQRGSTPLSPKKVFAS